MHQVVEDLFPYLVAFYLLDSLVYVRPGRHLLAALLGRSFERRGAGLHILAVAPTAEALVCDDASLVLTSRTVFGPNGPVPITELSAGAVEGRTLRCGPRLTVEAASPAEARRLAGLLERLKAAPEPARALKDHWERRYDVTAVRARRDAQRRPLRVVKGLSSALWVNLFVLLPATLYARAPGLLGPLLLASALLYLAVVVAADRMLRAGGLDRRARLGALSPLFLFPPAAAHAPGFVSRDLYETWDACAVAAVVLPPEAFREMAARERLRLVEEQRRAAEDEREHWTLRREAFDAALGAVGISSASLDVAVSRDDGSAAAYCPLCAAEYRSGFESCTDCGVALKPFA